MAFRVQSRLGRGRVVDTFDAILEVQGEKLDVVIKRVRPEFRENGALQEALYEWGLAQSDVDHPDVVAVLEAGRDADGVYIIQERVEGATLARVLATLRKNRRTLVSAYGLMIAERVAAGVAGLHASTAGHHGDLDPGEVLVGYDGAVKVGDQRLRDLVSIVGLDLDPVDEATEPGGPAADAQAFALIVLEIMLGHPVWKTSSMSTEDALRALADFAPIAQGQPTVARQLRDILASCLDPDPAGRPADFAPVAHALSDLISRNHIRRDPEGLGAFVELVSPPLEDADAPTRMATAPEADGMAAMAPDRKAVFEAASVVITPEILAQAEAAYRQRESKSAEGGSEAAPAGPMVAKVQGMSVAVEAPGSVPAVPPAPSSLRATAAELPNVAAKAAAAMSDSGVQTWWPYAVSVVLILTLVWWVSGSDARTLQLRVTSEPTEASVFVDGELVGQTPLKRPLSVDSDQIELRFEKPGYEAYRVTIGTQEDELRYEAPLKPLTSTR